jgi:hypothetical protein
MIGEQGVTGEEGESKKGLRIAANPFGTSKTTSKKSSSVDLQMCLLP